MSEADIEIERRALADLILSRALAIMGEQRIPAEVTVDRLMTCAAALVVSEDGAPAAVALFRAAADRIEAGALAPVENLPHLN